MLLLYVLRLSTPFPPGLHLVLTVNPAETGVVIAVAF